MKGLVMPIAVVTNSTSDRLPLKTLPEAYVVVRRMNYGEKLLRSNMATKLLMSGSRDKNDKDVQAEVDMQTELVAYWDFANLITEHNLQDADGRELNFRNPSDVKKLDSVIGEEVGQLIDNFNSPEESDEVKNF